MNEFLKKEHTWKYDMVLLLISAVLNGVLWWLLKNHYSFVYSMSDDMLYRDMVSGVLYGPVTHNIIYQHWFSLLISRLYGAVPGVEWCAMLTILLNYAASVTVYYCLCKLAKNLVSLIVGNGLYALFLLAYVRRFTFPTYTEIVGFLCGACILLYYTAMKRGRHSKPVYRVSIALCILYAVIGYSWRSESFLMMVPFAGAAWLATFLAGDRQIRVSSGIFAGILVAFIGLVILENQIAYSIPPYDHVMDIYAAKVTMTDYHGIPMYSEHQDWYEASGISEESAAYLYARAYPLAQDFSEESYIALGNFVDGQKKAVDLGEMKRLFKENLAFTNMGLLGKLALYTMLAAVILAIILRDKSRLLGMGFHLLAYGGVCAYLTYQGRIPDRIVVMAYMIMFVLSAMYVMDGVNQLTEGKWFVKAKVSIVAAGIAAIAFLPLLYTRVNPCKQELNDLQHLYTIFADRERGFYEYFAEHEDNFYLTTSFLWGTGGYMITEPQGIADNYAFINGYMIMIPEWKQKLQENGIDVEHILDSFIQDEHILLILNGDGLWQIIQNYLDENYQGRQLVKVDELIGFPVYNVE